jgi:hypothetical protein
MGAAIMPWLRKNERMSVLSADSSVRSWSTPALRKPSHSAVSRRVAMPACRTRGSTLKAKSQPHGGEPNSQSRTSPITKPTTSLPATATKNQRCSPRAAVP